MLLKVSFYFFAQFINSKLSNTRNTSPSIILTETTKIPTCRSSLLGLAEISVRCYYSNKVKNHHIQSKYITFSCSLMQIHNKRKLKMWGNEKLTNLFSLLFPETRRWFSAENRAKKGNIYCHLLQNVTSVATLPIPQAKKNNECLLTSVSCLVF